MAVFTAIATAIVTSVGITAATVGAFAYTFAVSVVATGLAAVTSRLINGTGSRGGAGGIQDQGVRVQLPPSTEAKVPVIYGTVYQQGIITDARISGSNNTMTYVLTLSEMTDTGNYSVGEIYWNDQKLLFNADGVTVSGSEVPTDSGTTTSTNLAGLVKVYVYAGGSDSANQIKGPTPAVNAYDVIPDCDNTYQMTDLVFALVQLTYSSEKNVTGLPTMTFQIQNSLKNPGLVWYDYMTNDRYGAGFTATDINTWTSIAVANTYSLYNISNTTATNSYIQTTATINTGTRFEINGVINTGDTVKTNLEKINLASASFTTFDHKLGQWKVVPNRALDQNELANCYIFTDDNILGDISLTATSLEDLYNQVEVSFANKGLRDQTDYFRYSIPLNERNDLEPDNRTTLSVSLVNDYTRAARIGYIELLQSRADLVINFQSDYQALQVEAGDVVKVTNSTYGFTEKPFRVTRIRETEGEDGTLQSEVTAIEYTATVYTDQLIIDTTTKPASNIPIAGDSGSYPAPSTPVATQNFDSYFDITSTVDSTSLPVTVMEFWYNTTTTDVGSVLGYSSQGSFIGGEVVPGVIFGLGSGVFYFRSRTRFGSITSPFSAWSGAYTWSPNYGPGDGGIIPEYEGPPP